ncbi:MAG: hypothetical protein WC292_05970 [Clostridia bacterium]
MPERNQVSTVKRIIFGDILPLNIVYREGLYYFYYSVGASVSRLVSADLISWEYDGDILKEKFPFGAGTGSALFRNGRVYVVYDRTGIRSRVNIVSSRDGMLFEKYPLPAISGKAKGGNPRVFYSGGVFHMLVAGKGIHLYRSDNLFDWEYNIEVFGAKAGVVYLSPSIVRLGGKNFIVYGEKDSRKESAFITECKIDIESRYFSLCGEPKELPILFPRTSTLKDGRVLLSGFVKNTPKKITILQELDYQNGIVCQPLRELREKRRDSRLLTATVIGKATYAGFEANNREITAETLLNAADSLEISLGGAITAGYKKSLGLFSLSVDGEKISVYVGAREQVNFDIIMANGLCEVYWDDVFLALPMQTMPSPSIEIKAQGSAVVSLCEFILDIE